MSDEQSARNELVAQYRRVGELKLNELASGNLSVRFNEGMLISPTGASSENITAESVVFVHLDGRFEGPRRPSSEWMMHARIYMDHAQTKAVVHTHSDYCVAVSCQNQALPGFHYLVGLLGGDDVPCVPYSTFGGEALAEAAAQALKNRRACLLGNHGMISHAETLSAAVGLAQRLEILCRQYVLTRQLGEPGLLSPAQWDEFFDKARAAKYGG